MSIRIFEERRAKGILNADVKALDKLHVVIPSEISVGHGDNEQGTGGRRTRNGYIEKTAGQANDQTEN